ncbi:hypothetical protein GNP94_22050 [Paenibacillus campinasensis]|uniref:Uncharacterized protein n=1 Tax=Paenibacillus campinasensis TaxID=66347 RepID=A0ABW9T6E5_9BACL|nr:hypothetical protein [Paenibacillus campinasensis]MUG68657.1 hypothetical protein [Paenibacillus campinasensis]
MNTLVPKAEQMIHDALAPLIHKGCTIERLKIVVASDAPLAQHKTIPTRFGMLRVEINNYARRGLAYIEEDPGRVGRGFAWVCK